MKKPRRTSSRLFVLVLLSGLVLLGSAAVQAQLTAEPTELAVSLQQRETTDRTVTLTNTGSEAASFCLSFERPLQRGAGQLEFSKQAPGAACGPLGEILFEIDEEDAGFFWNPNGLAMTPDGRLFVSEYFRSTPRTHEFTLELELLRSFEQPVVEELGISTVTQGVTFNADTGSLWWLNIERDVVNQQVVTRRALLLEGDLDGVPTGRRIELAPLEVGDPPEAVPPGALSYDPATQRYYFSSANGPNNSLVWAADTLGAVIPGYPVEQQAYPGAIAASPDAHGGASGEPEAVRLELIVASGNDGADRLVVVDPLGADLEIETPLPDVSGGTGFGSITGELLRSRVDPNGVLYFPFVNFDTKGIVGIRPHPLPPSWLALSEWDGTLGPGESTEITLTFSSGTRAVGNSYSAALQAFDAATGEATEVPLTFEVAPGTNAEDDAAALPTEASLSVFPNPAAGAATLAGTLPERAHLRLAVFDVLGRRVAQLADGQAEAGDHRFAFDGQHLPAGVYLIRAEFSGPGGGAEALTERITLVR